MARTITYESLLNIVAKAPGHFYWKDTKGVYQGSNDAQATFLGYQSGKDLIGKTDFDLPWKDQAVYLQQIDNQVITTKKEYSIEETVISHKGIKTIFLSRKIPLYDHKTKKVIGIIGSSLDITANKKAEIAKQDFLMNMAHDLRTPLAGIIGLTSALQANEPEAKIQEYARRIHGAGEQLLELLNAVLDNLNIEHQPEYLQLESVHLSQLTNELETLMRPSLETKHLGFSLKLDKHLPPIMTDRIKLKRLLINLLSNAVKFTQEGKVSLEVKLLTVDNQRAKILVTVRDTGIGIAEDKLNKIFDRFYRDQSLCFGVHTGYGLGLYLVKKATESLSGRIKVSSKQGKGSRFSLKFDFPLAKNSDLKSIEQMKSERIQPTINRRLGPVLVAEDNALVSYAVKALLTSLGYKVVAVTEGRTALDILQNQTFIWALLDIGLPKLQGTEIVSQYRHWEKQNNKAYLPIFAFTAHTEKKIKDHCEQVGFDYVLQKPFTEKDIDVIEKFLK